MIKIENKWHQTRYELKRFGKDLYVAFFVLFACSSGGFNSVLEVEGPNTNHPCPTLMMLSAFSLSHHPLMDN